MAEYDLARPDILEQFEDPDWFVHCFGLFYDRTAADWGCAVTVSGTRLHEVRDLYVEDLIRTRMFGMDRKDKESDAEQVLDHFKHGAFLTYWLKRNMPINSVDPILKDGKPASDEQKFFLRYGNEYCALLAGFKIVLNYQLQAKREKLKGDEAAKTEKISKMLAAAKMPDRFRNEYPRLVKHKALSPHAFYLMFTALFEHVSKDL
jgi:hypothetical protein